MKFTYSAYRKIIETLIDKGYSIDGYDSYQESLKTVILRHDVDTSLDKAVEMARIENTIREGVKSTYFVLVSSDFYNVFSKRSLMCIDQIVEYGHAIGLHFDEKKYFSQETWEADAIIEKILMEQRILEDMTGLKINSVSMHTPTRKTLDADLTIPGMINSYGKEFFSNFKYVSDSRRRWRENIEEIVDYGQYKQLHILTHAFWYHDQENDIKETICKFVNTANIDRYNSLKENITDLESVMTLSEVMT